VFQILLPLVSPFIDIMFAVGSLWYLVQKFFHPDSTDPASFQRLVIFFAAFLIIDFVTSAIAFALERRQPEAREDVWLLSQVWLQRFAYRQLFSVVLVKTLKRALEGQRFAWDKLERTAKMSYRPESVEESVEVKGGFDSVTNLGCDNFETKVSLQPSRVLGLGLSKHWYVRVRILPQAFVENETSMRDDFLECSQIIGV
jgi:hypothetical protein